MKTLFKAPLLLLPMTCVLLISGCFKPRHSFSLKIDYETKDHELFLCITNLTAREVLLDVFDLVKRKLDWRVCSGGAVILDNSLSPELDPRIPADHFPTSLRVGDGRRIRILNYYPHLGNVLTNSSADWLLWHCCVWDEQSHRWDQECGRISLKAVSENEVVGMDGR